MGATEILRALEKGDKLSVIEIANKSHCGFEAVKQGVRRLLKDTSVNLKFDLLDNEEKRKRYGHIKSGRIRIYWVDE